MPEFRVVLTVLKTVYRRDVGQKVSEVMRELKSLSDDPVIQRFIRTSYVYLMNSAKYLERDFEKLMKVFEETTGEKTMPTMMEKWKAECVKNYEEGIELGEARGILKGKIDGITGILRHRFKEVPTSLVEQLSSISDIERLDELFDLAFICDSLIAFADFLSE